MPCMAFYLTSIKSTHSNLSHIISSLPNPPKTNTTNRLTLPPPKLKTLILHLPHIPQITLLPSLLLLPFKPRPNLLHRPITARDQKQPPFSNQRQDFLSIRLSDSPSLGIGFV